MTIDTTLQTLDQLTARVVAAHPTCGILRPLLELRADEPFAAQRLAQTIQLDESAAYRIRLGYAQLFNHDHQRPFTARDAIAISGYRPIHSSAVAINIVEAVGGTKLGRTYTRFWWWTYAVSSFTSIIARAEQAHEDYAFAGAFLWNVAGLLLHRYEPDGARRAREQARRQLRPLHEAEQDVLGFSRLDLGPRIVEAWGLPPYVLPAFDADESERTSLAGMLRRARATAAHHGFANPVGLPPPPDEIAGGDPAVDAYVEQLGGPDAWRRGIRAFLSSAGIEFR